MTTYTDADVDRLVTAASDLRKSGYLDTSPHWMAELQAVLVPFLPDHEAELIEEMAKKMFEKGCQAPWEHTEHQDIWRKSARVALAVVRDHGLPE